MGIIDKLVKEKTTDGIFNEVKYSTLKKISFILVTVFMLNPALRLLVWLVLDISIYKFMHEYNGYVLFFGFGVFLIVLKKLSDGKKLGMQAVKDFIKSNIPIMLMLLFGLLMIITTFLNGAPKIAISGSYYRGEGLLGYLSYLIYFLLAVYMLSPRQKKVAVNIFAVSIAFVSVVICIDYIILGEKYELADEGNIMFSQYNHLGYYLMMGVMAFGMLFVTAKKLMNKIMYIAGFMIVLLALIMNDTWGCQLAIFAGVLFTVVVYSIGNRSFKSVTLVLIAAMLLTYLLACNTDDKLKRNIGNNIVQLFHDSKALVDKDEIEDHTTGVSRIVLWENALKLMCEKPIIGHGADVTGDRLLKMTKYYNDRCHCEYLNYAVCFGIPTTIVYIVAVFTVFLRGLFKRQHLCDINYLGLSGAFAYLVSAVIGNSMFYTAPFLFIMLGLGYVMREEVLND